MDRVSTAWVRAADVREQLRRLGRDDISDDAIERFLTRRRRDARARRREDDDDDHDDDDDNDDDHDDDATTVDSDDAPRRLGTATVGRRPPWNGDAFEVIPTERAPTSSARLNALPRRGGKIDVVRMNAEYARLWSSKAGAPAVVSGETRQKVGFAEKFRAAHEREAAAARRRRERRDDASRGKSPSDRLTITTL